MQGKTATAPAISKWSGNPVFECVPEHFNYELTHPCNLDSIQPHYIQTGVNRDTLFVLILALKHRL